MDDLLDLNFTSSPSSNPSRPTSTKPNPSLAFDNLSRSAGTPNYYGGASAQSSRSQTPQTAPIAQLARLAQPPRPSSGLGDRSNGPAVTASKPSGDAFSSLLSLGPAGGAGKESMAERAKRLEREKREKEESEKKHFDNGDFWEKFGGPSGPAPRIPAAHSSSKANGGLTGFDDLLQPSSSGSSTKPSPGTTPTILAPVPSVAPAKSSKGTFWDMEAGLTTVRSATSASNHSSSTSPLPSRSPAPPPSDPFDFELLAASAPKPSKLNGTSRPAVSSDWGDLDDDVLGDLARPVKQNAAAEVPQTRPPRITTRPSSPPPHVVGQIVEMGFSPAQARAALAKTSSGLDVAAALELLLGASAGSQPDRRDLHRDDLPEEVDEEEEDFIQRERSQREEQERERRRARRAGPSRDAITPRTKDEIRSAGTSGRGTPELGEQAEKYLAQASELGTNVLSKATSFWAAGKEKAQKLYEEQKRAYEAQQAAKEGGQVREGRPAGREPVRDGRPRWMIDAEAGEAEGEEKDPESGGGFRDDDDEGSPPRPSRGTRDSGASGSRPAPIRPEEPYRSVKERADLLFADEPQPYIPASRRKTPAPSAPATSKASRPISPSPPVLIQRQIVPASLSQLERAAAAKAKGNDHFKLGRFSESESAYSTAISSLPTGHLHLIALHNNRAASRLKLGQSDGVVEDCGAVLLIIGQSYHPAKEAPLSTEYADVRLPESMVKSLIKRAQAYEMGEKWKKALEDWERVMGLDAAFLGSGPGGQTTRNMAAEGARRARKIMDGGEPTAPKSNGSAPPRPAPRPAARTAARPAAPSTAVKELRQANLAQEKEDAERLRLKDPVEARLGVWKSGKETNLRALIASLDTVLWEGIMGGVKVGMHELISEKQVKIRYMKVIARLHPDKLDVKSTTVEQRMLANGVFGTLNEA